MKCSICGESAVFRAPQRSILCDACLATTPPKVSREEFVRVYFKGDDTVTWSVLKEFYSDYLASECNLEQYVKETTEVID